MGNAAYVRSARTRLDTASGDMKSASDCIGSAGSPAVTAPTAWTGCVSPDGVSATSGRFACFSSPAVVEAAIPVSEEWEDGSAACGLDGVFVGEIVCWEMVG